MAILQFMGFVCFEASFEQCIVYAPLQAEEPLWDGFRNPTGCRMAGSWGSHNKATEKPYLLGIFFSGGVRYRARSK